MDLKLTVICELEGQEKEYDLEFAQDLITIGRHSMNDVQIPDMQVSAEHARILVEDGEAYLVDLGSPLGTRLNGEAANPHQRKKLGAGDEILLASYRITLGRPAKKLDDTSSEKTAMVAMKMVREVLGNLSAEEKQTEDPPYLEVMNDAEAGTRLDLTDAGEYKLGREKACELVLKHWSISRKHALVRRDDQAVIVMDMGSKNGVLVNGEKVEETRRLKDGDVIAVGHTEVKFRNPARKMLDSMDIARTPVTNLKDLGLDAPSRSAQPPTAPPAAEPAAPEPAHTPEPPPEREPPPRPEPEPEYRPHPAPAASPSDPMPRRPIEPDSSLADYLPMIIGGVLILGAVIAALFLFVLN